MSCRISCVLAIDKPKFTGHAVSVFNRLNYAEKELVMVETRGGEYPGEVPEGARRLVVDPGLSLGARIQAGCQLATGELIHRFDEADYYGPSFLEHAAAIEKLGVELTWWNAHLIYWAGTDEFRLLPASQLCGSFVFTKKLWTRIGYPDVSDRPDMAFLIDAIRGHAKLAPIVTCPEAFGCVRHGEDTWTTIASPAGDQDVDEVLRHFSEPYTARGMPDEDLAFYRELVRVPVLPESLPIPIEPTGANQPVGKLRKLLWNAIGWGKVTRA